MASNSADMEGETSDNSALGIVKEVNTPGLIIVVIFVTLSVLMEHNLGKIVSFIVNVLAGPSETERDLMKKIIELKKSQQGISMVDEFAKHAKVQRQINKLQKELDSHTSERNVKAFKIQFVAPITLHVVRAMFSSYIVYIFWSIPLIIFSANYIGPFYLLISMPCFIENGVGVVFLMLMIYLTLRSIKKYIFAPKTVKTNKND